MAELVEFTRFIDELVKEVPSVEKEALALAIGFNPDIKRNTRLKLLKNYAKSQDIGLRRSALTAIAFSVLHEGTKGGKAQRKIINKYLKDSFSTIRLSAAISLSSMALLSNNGKIQKSIFNHFKKRVAKEKFQLRQGFTFGLGLLSMAVKPKKDVFPELMKLYNANDMGNISVFLIGLTFAAINSDNVETCFDFILNQVVPSLLDKESRRTAIICCAFLIPLFAVEKRLEPLEALLKSNAEFHSRFGSDSAIILAYFSLYQQKADIKKLQDLLAKYESLDTDYRQLKEITSRNKVGEILVSLIKKNSLDLKASAINGSFFLERAGYEKELESFVLAGLETPASGYFDRFLIILRTFSYCLMKEDLTKLGALKELFHVPDSWTKRLAALAYSSLKWRFGLELRSELYEEIKEESNEHVRWGLLVGVSVAEVIGRGRLDDELILGLLLLSLGHLEASTSLLVSQMLVSKFYD